MNIVSAETAASVQALCSDFGSTRRVLIAKMTSEAQNPKIFRQSSQAGDKGSILFSQEPTFRAVRGRWSSATSSACRNRRHKHHLVGRSFSRKGYGLIEIPTIEAYEHLVPEGPQEMWAEQT